MTAETTLTVRSPADLIAAVPYLLGFHPVDSLTVVAVRDNQVIFAARHDLPEPGIGEDAADSEARHVAMVVARQDVQGATVIGHGPAARVTPAALRLGDALDRLGIPVLDVLRVTDGRYWSYLCEEPSCCPPEGLPCDSDSTAVAAAATYAGQVALPDRESLAAQLAPVQGAERESMRAATHAAEQRLARLLDAVIDGSARPTRPVPTRPVPDQPVSGGPVPDGGVDRPGADGPVDRPAVGRARVDIAVSGFGLTEPGPGAGVAAADGGSRPDGGVAPVDVVAFGRELRRAGRTAVRSAARRYRDGGRLSDTEAAWLGVLLGHLPVRDFAWERIGNEQWHVALWTDVLRRVEPEHVPAPACLLAFAAWRAGHGALACVAVDRARTRDPEYPMAVLLDDVLRYALPPSTVDDWPAGQVTKGRRAGGRRRRRTGH
jgi:hypothetical protein